MKKTVKELMENYDKVEAKSEERLNNLREEVGVILQNLEGQDNEYNINLLANTLAIYMAMISEGDIKFHAFLMEKVVETMLETFKKGEEL